MQKLKSRVDNRNSFARSRSQSSSQVKPEVPTYSSYNEMLLQDIQKFHQRSKSRPRMSKTCAMTEVKNLPRRINYTKLDRFLESEAIFDDDDLTEPSYSKYVALGMDSDSRAGAYSEHQEYFGTNILPRNRHHSMSAPEESISSSRSIGRQNRLPSSGGKRFYQNNRVGQGRIVTP